ncbi:BFO_1060 family glycosyltransferase [Tunicatimonas pelagia]|uniref:BFO_1060 family glycosyltransferase n=1 Tax=Tunicatimonas pelagia TaxID=931531 RepID=UPI002666EFC0|nr:hypothetical protein [Tunicatimonas pelagia]WKN43244.1 hypothetical protein P0M28_29820 [Tunicatimonas pelagia]
MANSPKYIINCFLDNDSGRDVEILLPIVVFAEKHLNCTVNLRFLWDLHSLNRDKPHLVLLPNIRGHHMYFQIAKLCQQHSIPVFAHESEGNFRTDGSYEYWGYNLDKEFYQDWVCCWSERTRKFLLDLRPDQADKIVYTGAPGFDRYLFGKFAERETLLRKWNRSGFKRVIGYAGWAFGRIHGINRDTALIHIHPDFETRFQWAETQRKFVEGILEQTLQKYPDTLFIFKRHPKEIFEHETEQVKNEMNGLLRYPNVIYLVNEEPIHDLIAISDIWMGFETTTCMEAWLLQKPTILINQEVDFVRTEVYKGSPIAQDATQLHQMIDEYYQTGAIAAMEQAGLPEARKKVYDVAIGGSDGYNHIRTAFYLKQSLDRISPEKEQSRVKIGAYFILFYYFYHLVKHFYYRPLFARLPKLKKTLFIFEKWQLSDIHQRKAEIASYTKSFYQHRKITPVEADSDAWWERFLPAAVTKLVK